MLVLTRRPNQSIMIGDDIVVTVLEVKGDQIRLGISAPRSVQVFREEVLIALQEANRSAVFEAGAAPAAPVATQPDAPSDENTLPRPTPIRPTPGPPTPGRPGPGGGRSISPAPETPRQVQGERSARPVPQPPASRPAGSRSDSTRADRIDPDSSTSDSTRSDSTRPDSTRPAGSRPAA